jgi:hypothetical protein
LNRRGWQSQDVARHVRKIDHAGSEHGEIAKPERQPGKETDLRNVDDAQSELRINAVANGAAGKGSRADIMPDRIAREARQRRDPVRHVVCLDGAQCKQVVAGERAIGASDEEHRRSNVGAGHRPKVDRYPRGVDIAQQMGEHIDGCRDDRRAERESDPVPGGGRKDGIERAECPHQPSATSHTP